MRVGESFTEWWTLFIVDLAHTHDDKPQIGCKNFLEKLSVFISTF